MTTRTTRLFTLLSLLLLTFVLALSEVPWVSAGVPLDPPASTCLQCQQTTVPQTVNYYNFVQDGNFAVGNTGFGPLDTAVTMISKFFMIGPLRNNVTVQVGFIRFVLFIVLFTLFRFGLGKVFDAKDENQRKNINIIGFAIALIGAIFMKDQWVLANGGVMAAIAGLLVPLLIAIPALIYSFSSNKDGKSNNEGARNWIGVAVLFCALMIIMFYMNITGFASSMGAAGGAGSSDAKSASASSAAKAPAASTPAKTSTAPKPAPATPKPADTFKFQPPVSVA